MLGVYKDIAKLSSPLLGSNNAQPNPETEKSEEFTNIEQPNTTDMPDWHSDESDAQKRN